jgi:hypothetical protein
MRLADKGRSNAAAPLYNLALLGGDVDRGFGGFPGHGQGAAGAAFVEGDGEVFHWRGEFRDLHVDAGEVVAWPGIGGAPFAGLFADDQLPLICIGYREDRVVASGNGGAADVEVSVGDERGRFVCTGAPDLAVRNEVSENFPALHAWAGVIDLYGFSVGELAVGFRGRTGATGFVLRAGRGARDGETTEKTTKLFEHDVLQVEIWVRRSGRVYRRAIVPRRNCAAKGRDICRSWGHDIG